MYRWSYCTGGLTVQVVLLYRWSYCTGGLYVQVVCMYMWSYCTGGLTVQVVCMYRWSVCTGGLYVQVGSNKKIQALRLPRTLSYISEPDNPLQSGPVSYM